MVVATSRRITIRTTAAAGSSLHLPEARGDADGFLPGDLSFQPIRDPAGVPEERVAGKTQRVGLEVPGRVEVKELMWLTREPIRGAAVAERNGLELCIRSDGLPQDGRIETAFELNDDGTHAGLR